MPSRGPLPSISGEHKQRGTLMFLLPLLVSVLQLVAVPPAVSTQASDMVLADSGVVSTADSALDAGPDLGVSVIVMPASTIPGRLTALEEPATVSEAVGKVAVVVDLYKAGQWAALALALINLLMFVFKRAASDSVKRKWGFVVSTGLGGLVAALSLVITGTTLAEAALVFAMGPASSVIYDVIKALRTNKA